MDQTKPSPDDFYTASNAVHGYFNTYKAAEFMPLEKVHFYLWIHFGKTYLLVYMKCKLLKNEGFHLKIGRDEKLLGAKWLGYTSTSFCNNKSRLFKTSYKMVKGQYTRLAHSSKVGNAEFRLAKIKFYGF